MPQHSEHEIAMRLLEEKEKETNYRKYTGAFERWAEGSLVLWAIFQLCFNLTGTMDAMTFRAYHVLFLVGFTFLFFPSKKGDRERSAPPIADLILIGLAVGCFSYLIWNYTPIALRGGFLTDTDIAVGAVGIVLCFVAGRRAGGNLVLLAAIFLLYNFWGQFVPGALGHSGFGFRRVIGHMFWGSQGIFGVGIGVSTSYIFLFVLFGAFLKKSGFSSFLNDFALTLVGHSVGGPAKVAVVASALLGMINGSAVANVATTGAITIPMMKRTGYSKEFAAAVEATASTGGQFAPPIMGAVGFVMAEYLGISYTQVMIAAIIPAFLYYLGVICSVHFEAKRLGLRGLSRENLPSAKKLFRERGHLLLPIVVLLVLMMLGFTPLYCGAMAILATVIGAGLKKETRMSARDIFDALADGAKSAIGVGVSCILIGFIIGTVSLTGLGLSFGQVILDVVGEGQLFFGGFLVMVMSTILGMGVPGVAAYVIVATVAAPVLIRSGALPIAAHMFCLFYACLSNITPPVAMSSYVASAMAGSDQTKTSLIAVKLGIAGFIIPFFFLDNPVLLLQQTASPWVMAQAIVTASIGVVCISAALEGALLTKLRPVERIVLTAIGFLSIDPGQITDLIGLALLGVILALQLKRKNTLGRNYE